MIRQIIKIDKEKCVGCGLCVSACQEGAIGLVDGKAELLRDDYCDGLGNCLPVCPTEAITFERREAAEFDGAAECNGDEECNGGAAEFDGAAECDAGATTADMEDSQPETLACGCPGTHSRSLGRATEREPARISATPSRSEATPGLARATQPGIERAPILEQATPAPTHLNQWPVQIKLVPVNAPYFKNANLLVAADCAAYAYGNFHNDYMRRRITLIGCPKLDEGDYTGKLTAILKANDIKSVTVARMEVPCCGGIESAVKNALKDCGKMIPWQVVTISTDGEILEN